MSIFLEIVTYLNFYDLFYHFLSVDLQRIWHISTSNGRAYYSKIKLVSIYVVNSFQTDLEQQIKYASDKLNRDFLV